MKTTAGGRRSQHTAPLAGTALTRACETPGSRLPSARAAVVPSDDHARHRERGPLQDTRLSLPKTSRCPAGDAAAAVPQRLEVGDCLGAVGRVMPEV